MEGVDLRAVHNAGMPEFSSTFLRPEALDEAMAERQIKESRAAFTSTVRASCIHALLEHQLYADPPKSTLIFGVLKKDA